MFLLSLPVVVLLGLWTAPKASAAPKRATPIRTTSQGVRKSTTSPVVTRVTLPEAASSEGQTVVANALSLLGSRYRYGGAGPNGFDCSGFVSYVAKTTGVSVPRSSRAMYASLSKTSDLRPGDIVYFGKRSVTHVAIYIGDGKIVHASTPRTGVRQDSLSQMARVLGFKGASRIV